MKTFQLLAFSQVNYTVTSMSTGWNLIIHRRVLLIIGRVPEGAIPKGSIKSLRVWVSKSKVGTRYHSFTVRLQRRRLRLRMTSPEQDGTFRIFWLAWLGPPPRTFYLVLTCMAWPPPPSDRQKSFFVSGGVTTSSLRITPWLAVKSKHNYFAISVSVPLNFLKHQVLIKIR